MDDNEETKPEAKISRRTKHTLRKDRENEKSSKLNFPDPDAAHKKFMAIMIGLFVLVLTLMIVFSDYMDFSVDGGI